MGDVQGRLITYSSVWLVKMHICFAGKFLCLSEAGVIQVVHLVAHGKLFQRSEQEVSVRLSSHAIPQLLKDIGDDSEHLTQRSHAIPAAKHQTPLHITMQIISNINSLFTGLLISLHLSVYYPLYLIHCYSAQVNTYISQQVILISDSSNKISLTLQTFQML